MKLAILLLTVQVLVLSMAQLPWSQPTANLDEFGDPGADPEVCGEVGGIVKHSGDKFVCLTNKQTGADPGGCGEVGGIVRHSGDKWVHDDGCNLCRCFGTNPACTDVFCAHWLPWFNNRAGAPVVSPITAEITKIATTATSLLAATNAVGGCSEVNLVEVVSAKTQVVAGTNYILSLKLSTNCGVRQEKICDNIVVHKPLPFACQAEDGCLEIIRQEEIACYSREAQGDDYADNSHNWEDLFLGLKVLADQCRRGSNEATCNRTMGEASNRLKNIESDFSGIRAVCC